ncbi:MULTISPECIES: avidin/streptavidin family protein [unclassified Novosphingobium]|uniref:avidin/streptavidin family protein n=1 Tax=unclassified Novosphingobium TaxID=2644732 RepID=UPI0025F8AADE|nr:MULTISPECIES: avidin/streptavidin family protein [unclassified Novosphingobium]HQV04575.1 avidin/streptavidin family protein [Novosphingobium sp.]
MLHKNALKQAAGAATENAALDGTWYNQFGSQVTFQVNGNSLSGVFESEEVPGANPLAGFVNGDLIAFTVNFPGTGITAWAGAANTNNGIVTISTLWQMTTSLATDNEPEGAIFAGSDTFTQQPPA